MGNWKTIQPRPDAPWELYDLSCDISEENDVAAENPDLSAKMQAMATQAHQPAEEGTFDNREIHERDRRAKFGDPDRSRIDNTRVKTMPTEGLIPNAKCKIARFSSESGGNDRQAKSAIDGDPRTHWHTQFQGNIAKHPHELVIDLGETREVRGFRYLARQDGGWNGAVAQCEFCVGDDLDQFGEPVAKATFAKSRDAQEVTCDAVHGRYVLIRILSEVNGGPWASIAELGVVGK
jgi:hypothetical protein